MKIILRFLFMILQSTCYLATLSILHQFKPVPFPLDQVDISHLVSSAPDLGPNVKIPVLVSEYCRDSISDGAAVVISGGQAQQFSHSVIEAAASKGMDVQVQGESEGWTPGWECSQ